MSLASGPLPCRPADFQSVCLRSDSAQTIASNPLLSWSSPHATVAFDGAQVGDSYETSDYWAHHTAPTFPPGNAIDNYTLPLNGHGVVISASVASLAL